MLTEIVKRAITPCYWIMGAIYHAESEGRRDGQQSTESKWRRAAAEKQPAAA